MMSPTDAHGFQAPGSQGRGSQGRGSRGPGFRAHGGPYAHELRAAVSAAEHAGSLLTGSFARARTLRHKGAGADVALDLDLLAEEAILGRLRSAFPGDRFLSEEAGLLDGNGDRTWLIDPLDGSNNVAIGLPAYAVGIGLVTGGRPVLGVVHEPVTGSTWHAVTGRGAHGAAGPLPGPSSRLPASGPVVAWTQGYSVGRSHPAASCLLGTLERLSWRVLQLWAPLLAWTMLARGVIDGFVGFEAEGIDLPAGALLAAEAGVELRTLSGGRFEPGYAGPASARSFVAGRGETLEALLGVARAVGPR
ncbi:inositol monophosphatase family protein [Streptomyces chilikensis]|uniref:inositol monophosphatase family protein n=1 Tax=Streptomyces chilikensis TaxID=1194079 RepID=UPI001F0D5BB9|nr:inositol monophosphatase family protein [Streptomyces chilikensis]